MAENEGNVDEGFKPIRPKFHFGAWLRLHGVDLITIVLMGALTLGIYQASAVPRRLFPIYNQNLVANPEIAYPKQSEILPTWADGLISVLTPIVVMTIFQVRRRSIEDWLTTILGLIKRKYSFELFSIYTSNVALYYVGVVTGAVFQIFIKLLIGGPRPHFLAVCQPSISRGSQTGIGFGNIMYDRSVCTGDPKQIDDALRSMPSGHATAAWASMLYLSLYINAQLKVMSAHNPAYWKMILFFTPLLGACLICGTMSLNYYHHGRDILAGSLIGICTALVAFRQTFAAIWDFRFNHVLLPRTTSLFHRQPYPGRGLSYAYELTPPFLTYELPTSHEGGWENLYYRGAPGDTATLFGSTGRQATEIYGGRSVTSGGTAVSPSAAV